MDKVWFSLFIAHVSGIFKSPFAETKTNEILHILDVHTQVQIHYSMISKIYFAWQVYNAFVFQKVKNQ